MHASARGTCPARRRVRPVRPVLVLLAAALGWAAAAGVTLILDSVPADTPAGAVPTLGSNLNDWDPGAPGSSFTAVGDGSYRLVLEVPDGATLEYKVTLGSWGTVEKAGDGSDLPNRSLKVLGATTVTFAVARWAATSDAPAATAAAPTTSGTIERIEGVASPQLGNVRDLLVYLPPSYAADPTRRYPVLYLQDGQNVFDAGTSYSREEWGADEAAQALAADGLETILVGIPNMGVERLAEYGPFATAESGWQARGEAYAAFLVDTVKPLVDARYRTLPGRDTTGVAGSSAGAVISLYAALRHPLTFGFVGALSPAFHLGGDQILPWVAAHPAPGLRVWLDMGTQEGAGMLAGARYMADLLQGQGDGVRYLVDPEGSHFEASWRARFPDVLRWFLAPASARIEADAAALLDRARLAHGGPALTGLERLEVRFQATSFAQTGDPPTASQPIDARLLADRGARVVRLEYRAGGTLVMILQAADGGGWLWTVDGGPGGTTTAATRDQNDGLLLNLDSGPVGLALGSDGRDAARALGPTSAAGVSGEGVEVSTHGVVTRYVLASDGSLASERVLVPGAVPQDNRYLNLRQVDGLRFPFAIDQYVGDALVGSLRLTGLLVNPAWPEDVFAEP